MQSAAEIQHVGAGEIVFRQGEIGDRAYLIECGRVEISAVQNGMPRILSVLQAGDVFGEMTLIDNQPRSATAKALDDCALLPITRDLVETKLGNAEPLTRLLLKLILSRFRDTQGDAPPKPCLHEQTLQQVATELTIATDLRDALNNDELEVHYQPIVHLVDQSLAGFEALARWNQRGKGYVPPPKFIAVAEETGLILPLGRRVLETACAALQRLQADVGTSNGNALFMSINIAAAQLYHHGEAANLLETIRAAGATHRQIKLEITETALLDDPQAAARAMELLRDEGVRLAIDDFGTGYSGLNYLYRFPLHTLKIDRSFIARVPEDESCLRLVRAILGLCREMKLVAIAEGVETPDQAAALRALGCEYAQGYLFARPLPEEQTLQWAIGQPSARNVGDQARSLSLAGS